jgi:hypothetical protein
MFGVWEKFFGSCRKLFGFVYKMLLPFILLLTPDPSPQEMGKVLLLRRRI